MSIDDRVHALHPRAAGLAAWPLEKKADAALMAGTGICREAPAGPEAQGLQDRRRRQTRTGTALPVRAWRRTRNATCRAGIRIGDGLVRGAGGQVILADLLNGFGEPAIRIRRLTTSIGDGPAPWHDLIGPDINAFPPADHLAAWAGPVSGQPLPNARRGCNTTRPMPASPRPFTSWRGWRRQHDCQQAQEKQATIKPSCWRHDSPSTATIPGHSTIRNALPTP